MKRISSRSTLFYKRIFPLLWFGFIVFTATSSIWAGHRSHHPLPLAFLMPPAVMAVLGYVLFRRLIFDLVDEVWDDGDALIVRNAGKEERIGLDNIINVGFSTMTNPERVTLTLREPGILGKEVTFSPPRRFLSFTRSPIVGGLIERADQARRAKA
jgi:hypothetical protein